MKSRLCAVVSRSHGDVAPAVGWVEGHIGSARFLCMTCRVWVVKPAGTVASRIWHVDGELRTCRGRGGGGDKSRPRGMRERFGNMESPRNCIGWEFRRPFRLSDRSCDQVSKWAVPRPGYAKQTAGERAIRGAQRVLGRSAVGRSAAAAVGRPVGRPVAVTMRSVRRVAGFSFNDFQFKTFKTLLKFSTPPEIRGGKLKVY